MSMCVSVSISENVSVCELGMESTSVVHSELKNKKIGMLISLTQDIGFFHTFVPFTHTFKGFLKTNESN